MDPVVAGADAVVEIKTTEDCNARRKRLKMRGKGFNVEKLQNEFMWRRSSAGAG